MAEGSLVGPLVGALGSLVGALVGGVGGTLTGQFMISVREKDQIRRENRKRRADKLEELVAAVYDFDHWIINERQMNVLGNVMTREISPLARVQAISAVYFPQFKTLVEALEKKSFVYRMWMATARTRRELGEGERAQFGELEVLTPYGKSRDELVAELIRYAQRELSLS